MHRSLAEAIADLYKRYAVQEERVSIFRNSILVIATWHHHAIAFLCEGILGGGDPSALPYPCLLYKFVICKTLEYSAWQTMLLPYVSRSSYAPHPHSGSELHCSPPPHAGGARPGQFL